MLKCKQEKMEYAPSNGLFFSSPKILVQTGPKATNAFHGLRILFLLLLFKCSTEHDHFFFYKMISYFFFHKEYLIAKTTSTRSISQAKQPKRTLRFKGVQDVYVKKISRDSDVTLESDQSGSLLWYPFFFLLLLFILLLHLSCDSGVTITK